MNKVNQIKVKAVIRYNVQDGKQVAYFSKGGRFYKLIDSKTIRPMGKSYKGFSSLSTHWANTFGVTVVNEDEQLLWDNKPLGIDMDSFTFNTRRFSVV